MKTEEKPVPDVTTVKQLDKTIESIEEIYAKLGKQRLTGLTSLEDSVIYSSYSFLSTLVNNLKQIRRNYRIDLAPPAPTALTEKVTRVDQ